MKRNKKNRNFHFHPAITYLLLCLVTIVFSLIFSLLNAQSTYSLYSEISGDFTPITNSVLSLFNVSGIKYIFTTSVSAFANFSVLVNLIIILLGIGIMDKSGFMQTSVTLLTKRAKKQNVTFSLILICLLASIIGDLAYIILIPFTALFFYYGKRNPFIGIIASFGALTCGSGLSLLFTSIDSLLRNSTILNANRFAITYDFTETSLLFINLLAIIAVAIVFTRITENYVAKKLPKYEFTESQLEEDIVTKKEKRGMVLSLLVASIYIIIILYNIIPGLPLSGNLLDNSQLLYIDKLFSYESFFSNGFVFIVAFLFIILGLFYGIGSGSIKNNSDVVEGLSYSLDKIGKVIFLIFIASLLINIFKESNIGATLVTYFANIINDLGFTGLPLVILLFVVSIITTIFVPSSVVKWPIMATTVVPTFINSGLTPEFAQIVFRFGESVSMGITPLLSYFVVYIAFIEQYNQSDKSIGILSAIKYQLPYTLAVFVILLIIIVLFFFTNLPLGLGGAVSL